MFDSVEYFRILTLKQRFIKTKRQQKETPLIQVKAITKQFGQHIAVERMNLSLKAGEIVGMLGLNGAGKSTTLRMLSGYIPPDTGAILINNIDIVKHPQQAKALIGYLPEGAPSYRDLTVWQMLNFLAGVHGLDEKQTQLRIAYVVDVLDLSAVLLKPIETLSKGFKRRVGLAQTLLHSPDVLLLDEPTDGLDPKQKLQVRALIRSLATAQKKASETGESSSGKAVLISTHHFEDVEALCDRVLVLHHGKLICDTTPAKLKRLYDPIILIIAFADHYLVDDNTRELFSKVAKVSLKEDNAIELTPLIPDISASEFKAEILGLTHQYRLPLIDFTLQQQSLESVFDKIVGSDTQPLNSVVGAGL